MQAGMRLAGRTGPSDARPRTRRAAQLRRSLSARASASIRISVPLQQLAETARQRGFQPPRVVGSRTIAMPGSTGCWSRVWNRHLGVGQPTILFDYPGQPGGAGPIVREVPVPVAERFELYVDGVELANGYHELTDPEVLQPACAGSQRAARAPTANTRCRQRADCWPPCSMVCPPAPGVALGFDRLVMVALGAADLSQVMAFPIDRA